MLPLFAAVAILVATAATRSWLAGIEEQATSLAGPDELAAAFEEAAFWPDEAAIPLNAIQTWQVPVHVAVAGAGNERIRADVVEVADVFTAISGTPTDVAFVDYFPDVRTRIALNDHHHNLAVLLVPPDQYTKVAESLGRSEARLAEIEEGSICHALGAGGWFPVRVRYVIIPSDLDDSSTAGCVRHEMFHAFGFRGHPRSAGSILNVGWVRTNSLTVNDLILLRALYDPLIHPDMSRAEVLAVIPFIIAELRAAVAATDGDPLTVLGQPLRDLPEPEVSAR